MWQRPGILIAAVKSLQSTLCNIRIASGGRSTLSKFESTTDAVAILPFLRHGWSNCHKLRCSARERRRGCGQGRHLTVKTNQSFASATPYCRTALEPVGGWVGPTQQQLQGNQKSTGGSLTSTRAGLSDTSRGSLVVIEVELLPHGPARSRRGHQQRLRETKLASGHAQAAAQRLLSSMCCLDHGV